jgi:predicted small secreted protein
MFNVVKSFFLALFLMMGALSLTACNTIEGAGADIEAAGDAIEDSASDSKNY